VDYQSQDFVAVVKEATGGRGADVVFDPVGGEVFDKSTKCIAFEGRIVVIGFTSGTFPVARTNHLLVKNYGVLGLHWGLYNVQDPAAVQAAQRELFRLYAEGKVKPLVSEALPLSRAPEAMRRVSSRASVGKLVLVPGGA
jgi:NADPH2:quinone reductase